MSPFFYPPKNSAPASSALSFPSWRLSRRNFRHASGIYISPSDFDIRFWEKNEAAIVPECDTMRPIQVIAFSISFSYSLASRDSL
jgi:hypothetical protein